MENETSDIEIFSIQQVGYVKNKITERNLDSIKSVDPARREKALKDYQHQIRETLSIIRIRPEYEALLDGISSFSHIVVLFWPHLLDKAQRKKKKVHPRGWKDLPWQGIFATRSPARPNPILITTVELVKRDGCLLHVKGLEAFNNTPVIDIKPVIKPRDKLEGFRVPDWVRQVTHQVQP